MDEVADNFPLSLSLAPCGCYITSPPGYIIDNSLQPSITPVHPDTRGAGRVPFRLALQAYGEKKEWGGGGLPDLQSQNL